MEITRTPQLMTSWAKSRSRLGETICLVPTMGYLHEGHLSLSRRGCEVADKIVVSLFVNPIQFGPGEDLDSYPRNFERDAKLAEKSGADVLFCPEVKDIYPDGFQTTISVAGLTQGLCGASRPGHFDGVTTVVAKLFNIVQPDYAVFGLKDFQQLAVIKKMVHDLNWDISVIGHPIVREKDGLAMSSRNTYLNHEQREKALCLYKAIEFARKEVDSGRDDACNLQQEITKLVSGYGDVAIDYISIVDAVSLEKCKKVDRNSVLALAVKIGRTRLIDNGFLYEDA